jgi:hypothetical protein
MAVFLIPEDVFSLQAPYLIDAAANKERIIDVSWRNNSTDYDSVYILRKSDNEAFSVVRRLIGTKSEYPDSNLIPSHTYIYALIAKSADAFSDTSNSDTVTTLDFLCSFSVADASIHAKISAEWESTHLYTQITYTDSFCDERVLKIYCIEGNNSPRLIKTIDSAYTRKMSTTIKDTPSTYNRWCTYYSMSGDSSGMFYEKSSDRIFTLNTSTFFNQDSFTIDTEAFVSKYPIYAYGDSNTWAVKHGDSIWIKESNTADTVYSIINVEDPANPVFKGYRTYSVPCSLSQKGSPKICGNKLFMGKVLYRITDNGPEVINKSLPYSVITNNYLTYSGVKFYNDSLLLIPTNGVFTGIGILQDSTILASVTDVGTIDSIAVLPIGDYNNSSMGDSYSSIVCGPYHNFLFGYIINYYRKSGTDTRYIDFIQYFDDSKNFYLSKGLYYKTDTAYPTPPKLVNGYVMGDSLFIKAKFTYLDTVKKIAYLIQDSSMTVYSYKLTANENVPVKKLSTNKKCEQSFKAFYSNRQVIISAPDEFINGTAAIFDIKGRTIIKTKLASNVMHLKASSLTKGVYISAVFSQKGKQLIKSFIVR